MDVEVFKFSALMRAWSEATLKSDREHVTPYIWKNSSVKGGTLFSSLSIKGKENLSGLRLTIDEQSDLLLLSKLISEIGEDKSCGKTTAVVCCP